MVHSQDVSLADSYSISTLTAQDSFVTCIKTALQEKMRKVTFSLASDSAGQCNWKRSGTRDWHRAETPSFCSEMQQCQLVAHANSELTSIPGPATASSKELSHCNLLCLNSSSSYQRRKGIIFNHLFQLPRAHQ